MGLGPGVEPATDEPLPNSLIVSLKFVFRRKLLNPFWSSTTTKISCYLRLHL